MHYKGEWWIEGFEENKITGELSLNRKKISDSYLSIAKEFQTNQTGHDYPPKEEDQLFYPKTIYGNIPQVGNVSLYGCFLTGHPKYYNSLYNVYSFQQIALGIICNNIDEIKVKSICCKMNGINTWYPKSFFRYKGLGSKTFTLEQCIPNSQILISEINSVKIKIYLVLSSRRNMRKQSKKSISIKYAVLFESEKETSFHELFFYIRYSKYLFSILIGSPLKSGKYQSKDESGINSRKDIQFYLTEINNSGRKFSILEIFDTYNEDMIDIYINKYFELIRITEMNAVVLNIIEILNTTNKFTQEVFILILKTIELIFEYKYNQKFTYLDNEDFLEFTSNFKDFLDRLQLSNHHDSKYKEVFNKKIININQYSLRILTLLF